MQTIHYIKLYESVKTIFFLIMGTLRNMKSHQEGEWNPFKIWWSQWSNSHAKESCPTSQPIDNPSLAY